MELHNKVAVITGGSGGIGRAMAKVFLAEGARGVVIADLLQINTDTLLPEARSRSHYETVITAQGGQPPYRWALVGALPGSLKLSSNDNKAYIEGMPGRPLLQSSH